MKLTKSLLNARSSWVAYLRQSIQDGFQQVHAVEDEQLRRSCASQLQVSLQRPLLLPAHAPDRSLKQSPWTHQSDCLLECCNFAS